MLSSGIVNNKKIRLDIQGLRAIAVLAVIFNHAGFQFFNYGYMGVDIFFVISGYLVTKNILHLIEKGNFSLLEFYNKRARRLLPSLYCILFITIPFGWFLLMPDGLENFGQSLVATILLSNNILLSLTSGYWDTSSEFKPLLHTWSLGVEEKFYIILPFLIIFRKFTFQFLLIFFIASCLLFIVQFNNIKSFYLLPFRAWGLLAGSLVAYLNFNGRAISTINIRYFGFILITLSLMPSNIIIESHSIKHIFCTIGTCLLVAHPIERQSHRHKLFEFLLENRLFVYIGGISYSLYLTHQPTIAFFRISSFDKINFLQTSIAVFLSFITAHIVNKYIENRWRNVTSNRTFYSWIVSSSVLFLVIGLYLHLSSGAPFRIEGKTSLNLEINSQSYNMDILNKHSHTKDLNKSNFDVIVIGDSFGRDFTNILFETYPNFKSRLIYTDFHPQYCEENPLPEKITPKSSFILFLAFKNYDGLCFDEFNTAIKNLKGNLAIVGPKDFGRNINPFMMLHNLGSTKSVALVSDEIIFKNKKLLSIIPENKFINMLSTTNEEESQIPIFTDNNFLVTFDGLHLTKEGAIFMGKLLKKQIDPIIESTFED